MTLEMAILRAYSMNCSQCQRLSFLPEVSILQEQGWGEGRNIYPLNGPVIHTVGSAILACQMWATDFQPEPAFLSKGVQ
jgi:hypothetical protein